MIMQPPLQQQQQPSINISNSSSTVQQQQHGGYPLNPMTQAPAGYSPQVDMSGNVKYQKFV